MTLPFLILGLFCAGICGRSAKESFPFGAVTFSLLALAFGYVAGKL